jgi:DNA-binding NarL/FixJ family response regulator
MKKIGLLIIEDNRVLREGLAVMLNDCADIKILAATGAVNAAQKVLQLNPQVVLLNRGLQKQSCLQVLKKIRVDAPNTGLIVMDLMPGQTDVMEFVQAGVTGFILSNASFEDFIMTIRAVARGEKVLPNPLTTSLFSQIVENAVRAGKISLFKRSVKMTAREQEVIALIGQGMSNKEIAQNLNLATFTVKSHVHNILEKLALHSRLQVAAYSHSQTDSGSTSED